MAEFHKAHICTFVYSIRNVDYGCAYMRFAEFIQHVVCRYRMSDFHFRDKNKEL